MADARVADLPLDGVERMSPGRREIPLNRKAFAGSCLGCELRWRYVRHVLLLSVSPRRLVCPRLDSVAVKGGREWSRMTRTENLPDRGFCRRPVQYLYFTARLLQLGPHDPRKTARWGLRRRPSGWPPLLRPSRGCGAARSRSALREPAGSPSRCARRSPSGAASPSCGASPPPGVARTSAVAAATACAALFAVSAVAPRLAAADADQALPAASGTGPPGCASPCPGRLPRAGLTPCPSTRVARGQCPARLAPAGHGRASPANRRSGLAAADARLSGGRPAP